MKTNQLLGYPHLNTSISGPQKCRLTTPMGCWASRVPGHPSLEALPLGFGESLRQDAMPKLLIQTSSSGTGEAKIGSSPVQRSLKKQNFQVVHLNFGILLMFLGGCIKKRMSPMSSQSFTVKFQQIMDHST